MANKLPFLTVPQAAKLAGVDDETIRRWCRAGHIDFGTVAGQTAVYRDSLQSYVKLERPLLTRRTSGTSYTGRGTIITDRPNLHPDRVAANKKRLDRIVTTASTAVVLDAQGNPIGHIERKS